MTPLLSSLPPPPSQVQLGHKPPLTPSHPHPPPSQVQLGHKRFGVISVTDLHDCWVDDALKGLAKGAYVRCKVLKTQAAGGGGAGAGADKKATAAANAAEASRTQMVHLSARPSHGGCVAGMQQATLPSTSAAAAGGSRKRAAAAATAAAVAPESVSVDAVSVGEKLRGYVKLVGPKGLFLALDRVLDARIRIRNLSDG